MSGLLDFDGQSGDGHGPAIDAGADWSVTLTWKIDSTPVNIADYSARMKLRKRVSSGDEVLTLTHEDAITLGGAAGTIQIDLTPDQTTALDTDRYAYDLELESPSGVVTRLVRGHITVRPEVTK